MAKAPAKKSVGKPRTSRSGPSQSDQSKRFVEKVRELEAAGDLNPTEAGKRFEKLMGNLALNTEPPPKPKRASR